jgi:hypothetical protein
VTAVYAPVGMVRAHARRGPALTHQSLLRAVVRVSLCCFAILRVPVCTGVCVLLGQGCTAARLCAPCLCEGAFARCTATMRMKRATWFADKEGHVRGGDPWTGPAAFSPPPGRGGVCGDRALPHGPRSLSTSRQCTPRASLGRRTLGRATGGGAGPSAPREPAGRAPLPTRPCPVVGTMPIGGHPAAPPGPSWHRGRRRWAQRDRLALGSRVTPRALGPLIDRIVHSISRSRG